MAGDGPQQNIAFAGNTRRIWSSPKNSALNDLCKYKQLVEWRTVQFSKDMQKFICVSWLNCRVTETTKND